MAQHEIQHYPVAAIQFEPTLGAKAENLARLLALTEQAAQHGAKLIVHPEMATTGYCWYDRAEIASLVEPIPGPTTDAVAALAQQYDCYVVVGLPEVAPRTGIFYNSAALVGPTGVIDTYRKTHSYISEPKWAKDGDLGLPVWDTPLGRIGILICMDADYFEPARLLALQGADVLCFPTNWLEEKSPSAAWIARAYENGCYLIAANRYGLERGVQFSGGSAVLDPDGGIQAMRDTDDGVVFGEVDLAQARSKRFVPDGSAEKITARRPALYDTLTLNSYLFNPIEFHRLYGHRPLPAGRRSRVAAAQLNPVPGNVAGNLEAITQVVQDIHGVDLTVFPEYALTGRPGDGSDAAACAQPSQPGWLADLTALAARHQMHLVVGFVEQLDGQLFSTTLLIGAAGELARYRKAHVVGAERAWCTPGSARSPVIDLPLGRVGLLLGSDLNAPEAARVLALAGCDLLAVPAGPNLPRVVSLGATAVPLTPPGIVEADPTHFHLARQRAAENNCYLAFASLPAPDGIGHSAVFGPSSTFRREDEVLPASGTGVVTREIDTTNLDTPVPTCAVRIKDYLRMRQPHLYDLLQDPEPPVVERS